MTTLIWWAVLAVYAAGVFPSAVKLTRWHATRGYCHTESRFSSSFRWSKPDECKRHCREGCWRADPPGIRDLRATPAAVAWPLALLGLMVLMQARKQPTVSDLARQIADLEAGLGIGDAA